MKSLLLAVAVSLAFAAQSLVAASVEVSLLKTKPEDLQKALHKCFQAAGAKSELGPDQTLYVQGKFMKSRITVQAKGDKGILIASAHMVMGWEPSPGRTLAVLDYLRDNYRDYARFEAGTGGVLVFHFFLPIDQTITSAQLTEFLARIDRDSIHVMNDPVSEKTGRKVVATYLTGNSFGTSTR